MNAEELLLPVSDDAPAGEDLSYDPGRLLIEEAFDTAAQGGAADVDWRDVICQIELQLGRSKDVWLAVALARAGARAGRLDTIEAGCLTLAGLFERYWETALPSLDEYGLQGRNGPCESLTRIGEFLGPLRRTVLIAHPRLGSYTGEDVERFARDGEAADGYGLYRAALADLAPEQLQAAADRLASIRAAIAAADAQLTAHAAALGDTGTNFQATYAAIDAIRAALAPHVTSDDAPVEVIAPAGTTVDVAPAPVISRDPARVESREDVGRALDAVIDYYGRREPSSPIPVALMRVKGWIAMDFMAILKDISPNGVGDATSVLMARAEENSSTW